MLKKTALALATATVLLTACSDDNSNIESFTFYVTDGAAIYTVDSANSLDIGKKDLIGLKSGTLLYAIDVNPRGGVLNGIGSDGTSYRIDPATGTLTPANGTPDSSNSLVNKAVEIDYNPTVANQQVYRVTASGGENYRVNESTSAKVAGTGTASSGSTRGTGSAGVAGNDLLFQYATGDKNEGKSVVVSGIAYTSSQLNSGVPADTTVYAIDSQNNTLALLGGDPAVGTAGDPKNPNGGILTTVGPLKEDVGAFVGFDIASFGVSGAGSKSATNPVTNKAYATTFKDGTYNLYSVNLRTGAMTFITALNPKIVPARSFAVKQGN